MTLEAKNKLNPFNSKKPVAAIFLLGTLLRFQETMSRNFLFLIDQGRDMMAVKRIIYDHSPTLIGPYTSLQGVFQGPLWYYLLAVPTVILDGNPWGTVVLMLTISLSALIVAYLWTKKLFGQTAAIFTLFLFAISPEAVAAATYTWNPHPMWLLVILYIFSFYELVVLKKQRYHLAVWPLISLMFHFQTALAVFIFAASLVFLVIFSRKNITQKNFFYGTIIGGIFFIPQVLFELRHDFLMTRSVLNIFSGHDRGLFVGGENRNYFDLIQSHISLFYYNFGTTFVRDGFLKYLPKLALLLLIASLALQRRFRLFSKSEWSFILMIAGLMGIIIIFGIIYPFPLRYWFLTGLQAIYIVPFGLLLSKAWKGVVGKFGVLIFIAFLMFYSGQKLYSLYMRPPNDGGVAKIKGKLAAIDFIYNDAKGKPFGLLVFTPPVYTYVYDYLIWWHGERKYKYKPYQDKKGTFYLLMEIDPQKPWSYKGWLETVIKSGDIIYTKTLPSGLIVQKRFVGNSNEL